MNNEIIYFHIDNKDFLPIGIKFEKISKIDSYGDSSLSNVMIQDLLDYYPKSDASSLLTLICTKLTSGGQLSIQGIDLKQLCVSVCCDEIPVDAAQTLLYSNKKSASSIYELENLLKSIGFDIITKKYINIFEYYILAKKI